MKLAANNNALRKIPAPFVRPRGSPQGTVDYQLDIFNKRLTGLHLFIHRARNVTRMRREWEAQRNALATVRRFNATLSAKGYVWFWPKIAAALTSKHHWLVINCDSCGTVVDLDLRVKPRDPEASIRVALRDVQCPRCNGHGRPRIIALARSTA
jgi:hypothetical protein